MYDFRTIVCSTVYTHKQTAGSALTCAGGLVTLGGEGGGQGGGGGVGGGAGRLARVLQAALQGVHVSLQRDHRPDITLVLHRSHVSAGMKYCERSDKAPLSKNVNGKILSIYGVLFSRPGWAWSPPK